MKDSEIIKECGDDAAKWARAFAAAIAENPGIATDEATMIGWFANAIESRPRPAPFHGVLRTCHPGNKCSNYPDCESCGPARI